MHQRIDVQSGTARTLQQPASDRVDPALQGRAMVHRGLAHGMRQRQLRLFPLQALALTPIRLRVVCDDHRHHAAVHLRDRQRLACRVRPVLFERLLRVHRLRVTLDDAANRFRRQRHTIVLAQLADDLPEGDIGTEIVLPRNVDRSRDPSLFEAVTACSLFLARCCLSDYFTAHFPVFSAVRAAGLPGLSAAVEER